MIRGIIILVLAVSAGVGTIVFWPEGNAPPPANPTMWIQTDKCAVCTDGQWRMIEHGYSKDGSMSWRVGAIVQTPGENAKQIMIPLDVEKGKPNAKDTQND